MNASRTLTAILGVAESIASNWQMYEQVEAGLLPSPLHGTSYDGTGGHSSTIPDPTGSLATQLTASGHGIHNLADTTDCLEAVLTQLRWAQRRVQTIIRQHPDIARDLEATLAKLTCDGTYEAWCKRPVWKDGKCQQCYNNDAKARQRARERRTPVDMSTRPVLEPLACEPRPVEPTAPMRSAIIECRWCDWQDSTSGTDDAELTRYLEGMLEVHMISHRVDEHGPTARVTRRRG